MSRSIAALPALTFGPAPLVSVGVPVYNGAQYLEYTLEALCDQDFREIEVVISDNGSTDGTRAIAERFVNQDSRFGYTRLETNRGLPANYNTCLAHARAPYFVWNASDDLMRPGHLARCYAAYEARRDAAIVFSHAEEIDGDGRVVRPYKDDELNLDGPSPAQRIRTYLARDIHMVGMGAMFRTDLLRRIGGMPPYYGSDIPLAVHLALIGPLVQVPGIGFASREHELRLTTMGRTDPVGQSAIHDGHTSPLIALKHWRLSAETVAVAFRVRLTMSERLKALTEILRWLNLRERGILTVELQTNIRRLRPSRITQYVKRKLTN